MSHRPDSCRWGLGYSCWLEPRRWHSSAFFSGWIKFLFSAISNIPQRNHKFEFLNFLRAFFERFWRRSSFFLLRSQINAIIFFVFATRNWWFKGTTKELFCAYGCVEFFFVSWKSSTVEKLKTIFRITRKTIFQPLHSITFAILWNHKAKLFTVTNYFLP